MYVIGTAGHVDHGKSTLVKALTGIDPDRWEEEQRREMTIDLGFAWLRLPSGRRVSLVDVPGHERFIKNMLAGVAGFDAALLVIAADESMMPQTIEHLSILDLLAVRHGVVVLTKADLVDSEWLTLVREEVTERLARTSLAGAPLVAVSARTGAGLDTLRMTLDQVLEATPSRTGAQGLPRLPVDRAFTMGGFGTVVTGTLLDGPLRVGDELELLPRGLRGRIRGLQSHKQRDEVALPGTRVAVNLAGIAHHEVVRGDVLTVPGSLQPTDLLDVRLRVLPDVPTPLHQNMALDLFTGASEVRCRLTLLDAEQLEAGAEGWVQLRLEHPLAVVRGDRCILRVASPSRTVAGGMIVDTHPRRHRRFRPEVLAALEIMVRGDPTELVLQALGDGPPRPWDEVCDQAGVPHQMASDVIQRLAVAEQVIILPETKEPRRTLDQVGLSPTEPPGLLITSAGWHKLTERLEPTLRAYHGRFPLRRGMPREEVRQKLRLSARSLGPYLDAAVQRGLIGQDETSVWLTGHNPQPNPTEQGMLEAALAVMARTPYSPPAPELEAELLAWALARRLLVRVAADVFFLPQTYDELVAWVQTTICTEGIVTVGGLRDRFGSSRKYALALLEHLDERKVTRRQGEGRVLA